MCATMLRSRNLGACLLQGVEGAEQNPAGEDHNELVAAGGYAREADAAVINRKRAFWRLCLLPAGAIF